MYYMDFVNWLLFNSCMCNFLYFLFFIRFDNDEVSLKCISWVLKKFFFMLLLAFNKLLFKNLAILHILVNCTIKSIRIIQPDQFEVIFVGIDNFSIKCAWVHISLNNNSTLNNDTTISLLNILVEVALENITTNILTILSTVAVTIIIKMLADVHFLIIWLDYKSVSVTFASCKVPLVKRSIWVKNYAAAIPHSIWVFFTFINCTISVGLC